MDSKSHAFKLFSKLFQTMDHTHRGYFDQVGFLNIRMFIFKFAYELLFFSGAHVNANDGEFTRGIFFDGRGSTLSFFCRYSVHDIPCFFHDFEDMPCSSESVLFDLLGCIIFFVEFGFGVAIDGDGGIFIFF